MGFQNYIEELNTAHAVFIDENQEKTKKKNKFNKNENWEELEAQQQKLFELSRNFSLPPESLQNSKNDSNDQKPRLSVSADTANLTLEAKKNEEVFKNAFKKMNEDEDYENFE